MDELREMECGLMEELRFHTEYLGLRPEELREKGIWRISEFLEFENWPEHSHTADLQFKCKVPMPLATLSSLCEAVAWMDIYHGREIKEISLLVEVATRLAFIHGFAAGMVYEDESRRERLSRQGEAGGKGKHRHHAVMRAWVLENMNERMPKNRNAAARLVEKLPSNLSDVSADPERFIYEVLRKS